MIGGIELYGWKNPEAGKPVQRRNARYLHVSSWGHDCLKFDISELKVMKQLIDTVKQYGEDGKLGVRFRFPKDNEYPTYGTPLYEIKNNSVLIVAHPVYEKRIPEQLRKTFELSWLKKKELIEQLESASKWMKNIETNVNTSSVFALSSLRMIVGQFKHVACGGCRRPYYEHIKRQNSFHVCPYCGWVYKGSNIQFTPQRRLNADGQIDKMKLNCAAPGQTTVKIAVRRGGRKAIRHPENVSHKARANVRIKTMMGVLCVHLQCDTGDGDFHIRKWACDRFDKYSDYLAVESTYNNDINSKQKMGQWQVACVFVWYSILAFEKRTYQPSCWSLSVICEKGGELHQADGYIPNWGKRGKKRKTRPLSFETVHRYAVDILKQWGLDGKRWCNIKIPDIHSVDCLREKNMESSVNRYVECVGKKIQKIFLPTDQSWDLDIFMENHVVKLKPDIDGVGFKYGLRPEDILKEVNGINIGKTVDSAYELIIEQKKSKKRKGVKNIITLTILR